jgi:ABC-type multidrug transport system fused ATPase/permease subunit
MCLVGIILIELYFGGSLLILIPQLTVFLAATFRIIPSANKILTQAQVIKVSNASIDLVYQELSTSDVSYFNDFTFEGHQNTILFKSLELKNISFKYNLNEDLILNNLNFKIIKGESIGIKGESGAGKSTFIDIVLGLLIPHEGSIILNGEKDQSKINGKMNVGYVPQNIFLLDESIEKNIALGIQEEEIDSSKILLAIKSAQLDTFVNSLPNGLKTVIGERGVRLSGGQRQRIGIARALYNDPEIIILDEATSSLDNETEASFMKTIYSLKGEKTLLIVAHRLSTLNNCDKILTINKDF